jgi:hypothetical protein
VDELKAPASATPIWALSWFLNFYVAGLPADVADRFRKLSVEGLMARAEEYLGRDFVTECGRRPTSSSPAAASSSGPAARAGGPSAGLTTL